MTRFDYIELVIFGLALFFFIPMMGTYMAQVFEGRPPRFARFLGWLEKSIYRVCQIDPFQEMNWREYAKALLYFNLIGFCFLFLLLITQGWLFLNPAHLSNLNWSLALNTSLSFVTNTDWQSYTGESTLSYLSQSVGLTVQNFLSAATGCATLLGLTRGITRQSTHLIGNFWTDLTRGVIYVLLPLSFILAIVLVHQGVIQNYSAYQEVVTLENDQQLIPLGPVASQVSIRQLGTNGGGYFGANSAHPFSNPTPLSNLLELFGIICIPASLVYMYGILSGFKKHGLILLSTMILMWVIFFCCALYAQSLPNPVMTFNPVLEGQETRIGTTNSILWAITTTATSNGSVNTMHDSLSPLAGGIALFQIMLGEIIFGGLGSGLCSMLMFVFITVFLAGLMVGRTPEYLGKKIEKTEIQLAMIAILTPCALILLGTCLALLLPNILSFLGNQGPHGLSEILYAFSSSTNGNGSAFAGFDTNSPFYHVLLGLMMLIGRLGILIPSLAIAGHLAYKNTLVTSVGTFKTDTILFGVLLISVILIIAGLTFFPALALGPIIEHLLMQRGQAF